MPEDAPRGSAVLCHPHPRHGGSKDHPLLWAIRNELAAAHELAVLGFNFRGVMGSTGTYGGGRDELRDARRRDRARPRRRPPRTCRRSWSGWSFGANVAIRAAIDDRRVAGAGRWSAFPSCPTTCRCRRCPTRRTCARSAAPHCSSRASTTRSRRPRSCGPTPPRSPTRGDGRGGHRPLLLAAGAEGRRADRRLRRARAHSGLNEPGVAVRVSVRPRIHRRAPARAAATRRAAPPRARARTARPRRTHPRRHGDDRDRDPQPGTCPTTAAGASASTVADADAPARGGALAEHDDERRT